MDPAPSATPKEELIVKACGKREMESSYMMAKFPRGWPDWSAGPFSTTREVDSTIPKRKRTPQFVREQPLLLQGTKAGADGKTPGFRGTLDGTQSGSAGFFMLIKEGSSFVAVPMDGWMTFRPAVKHQAMSLEEAERFMWDRKGGTSALETSHPRLASKAAMGDSGEGGPVSVHALVKREAPTVPDTRPRDDAPEEEVPERDPVKREEGEEDWEHEQQAQDDDLDMGEEGPEEAPVPQQEDSAEARQRDAAQGGEEEVQGELSRIIKKHSTMMSGDDPDGVASDEEDEEDEDEEDAEDLDTMANRLQVKGSAALRDPTPPAAAKGKTPPVSTAGKRKGPEGSGEGGEAAKRSKVARTPSPAPAVAGLGAQVEAAVRGLVGSRPPRSVTMKDVTAMCKTKFAGSEWQEAIKPLLKRVLKLETDKDGNKWLALR